MVNHKQSFNIFRDHLQRAKNNLNLALNCKEVDLLGMEPLKETIIKMRNNLDALVTAADSALKGQNTKYGKKS